jgi:hypothetical protein
MGGRNDEIVGVDRREIEFARMRSDMARALRTSHGLRRALSKTYAFMTHNLIYLKTCDVALPMDMQSCLICVAQGRNAFEHQGQVGR